MSWFHYKAKYYKENGEIDRKKEIDNWFNTNSSHEFLSFKVLKSSMVNSVYYAAIEQKNNETKETKIFATICLTKVDNKKYFNFSFKEMNEFMGPCEHKCPIGILEILSQTDNAMAIDWRVRCRNYHRKRNIINSLPAYGRKNGKIKFTPSYNLSSGYQKDIPIELYWQPVGYLYNPNPQGYWTDGKCSFSPKLLMTGIVEKI